MVGDSKLVPNASALHSRVARNKAAMFFVYTALGWLACAAACAVINASVLLCSSDYGLEVLQVASILVLFLDLPIVIPVGITVGLLAVLVSLFLDNEGKSNLRRYSMAFILCQLAGVIMLPAWCSMLEQSAAVAPPVVTAKLGFLQKIKNEHAAEISQVDHFVSSRPSVRQGSCMFGPDFWASAPGDSSYIQLLNSLKQLHSIQRCIDSSEVPLLVFPNTVMFALWGLDMRRKILKKESAASR